MKKSAMFVLIWQDSDTVTEVAVRMSRFYKKAYQPEEMWQRAVAYREKGVKLKVIQRSALPDYTGPEHIRVTTEGPAAR